MKSEYEIVRTTMYAFDIKRIEHRKKIDISHIEEIVSLMENGRRLPKWSKDHAVEGFKTGTRQCAISPDGTVLMTYRKVKDVIILYHIEIPQDREAIAKANMIRKNGFRVA